MANNINLGTYHDTYFKLSESEKTQDEFEALTDSKEIDKIKNEYAAWVKKYMDKVPENTAPENSGIEAEKSYFATREDEVAALTGEERTKTRSKLKKEYEDAGWKTFSLNMSAGSGSIVQKFTYHYNPKDPEFEGKTQQELHDHFLKKFKEERGEDNDDKPKDELTVSDHDEAPQPENNNEPNSDWITEEEKYWRDDFCAKKQYGYVRDPNQTIGFGFDIYKTEEEKTAGKPSAKIHYKDRNSVAVAGKDGKPADYDILKGLAGDAKRRDAVIRFDPQASAEFSSKLKLACITNGVEMSGAPEGKIDASAFMDQLSEEDKKAVNAYNKSFDERNNESTPKDPEYDSCVKKVDEQVKNGATEIDLNGVEPADAARMLAAARIKGVKAVNGPEYVDYKGLDMSKPKVKNAAGQDVFDKSDMAKALENLPDDAKAALAEHNREYRQSQIESARARIDGDNQYQGVRAAEEGRRTAFHAEENKYGTTGQNTEQTKKEHVSAVQQFWANKRQNS